MLRNGFRRTRDTRSEQLEARHLLAAAPFISELQSRNESTIQDLDGEYSDWIEIGNRGDETFNLNGWYLTDDPQTLTKWRFQDSVVAPGSHLIVFASGKNRATPVDQPHTNFRLRSSGEYLALVKPDGRTIAHDFGERFPALSADQSYGVTVHREAASLVTDETRIRAWVPTDDSLGDRWRELEFDDSTWQAGSNSVGYEFPRSAYTIREEFDSPDSIWETQIPADSGAVVEPLEGQLRLTVPPQHETSIVDRGLAPMIIADPPADATVYEIITHIRKDDPNDRNNVGLAILDGNTGHAALMLVQSTRRGFAVTNGALAYHEIVQLQDGSFYLRWVRDTTARTWTASVRIEETDDWIEVISLREGHTTQEIKAPKFAIYAATGSTAFAGAVESAEFRVHDQEPHYQSSIDFNLADSMFQANSSVYLRIPFHLDDLPDRFDTLDLGVDVDDGFIAYLNGDQIASYNAATENPWNAAADAVHNAGSDDPIAKNRFEVADPQSVLRHGDNLLAIHGLNIAADDADFFMRAFINGNTSSTLVTDFLSTPTPGGANQRPLAPSPRLISGDHQVFFETTTIEFAPFDNSESLVVHYTTDGTIPTRSSPLYTEPFTVQSSTILTARTFDKSPFPTLAPSQPLSSTLIGLENALKSRESELPLMILDTVGGEIPGGDTGDLQLVNVAVFDTDSESNTATLTSSKLDYLGRGGVRDRGSSTSGQPKPNLTFETWGRDGRTRDDDADVSLLGMPADSDWVLYAPFEIDPAFIRNAFTFDISRQMGHWAPRTRLVEVYLNRDTDIITEADYAGVYVLTEKIKRGDQRVDVTPITANDLLAPEVTGGYIWKIDRPDPDAPSFEAGGTDLNWVYPKSPFSHTASKDQRATIEQQVWAQEHLKRLTETLQSPNLHDLEGYGRYLDVDSWIDMHIINTLMRNIDAFDRSTFLHQDRGGKLVYGPVWDFDRAADSKDGRDDDPEATLLSSSWYRFLDDDPGFRQRYTDRWAEWRQTVLSDDNLAMTIDRLTKDADPAAERNFARWPSTAPRTESLFAAGELDGTFRGEVRHLLAWLTHRAGFIDRQFAGSPIVHAADQLVQANSQTSLFVGQSVAISGDLINVFTDTSIVGSPHETTVARYFLPTDDELETTWTDPDFNDADWTNGELGLGFDDRGRFNDQFKTMVDPRINKGATNVLVRVAFDLDDLSLLEDRRLFLRMKYDDGFVAYLNGTEVARSHLPLGEIGWNSGAANRDNRAAVVFEDFDISRFQTQLQPGRNVLSIRLVNGSVRSSDLLLHPELIARLTTKSTNPAATVYYTTDGTDPRQTDGTPSASASIATAETRLMLTRDTRVTVRNFDDSERDGSTLDTAWSAPGRYDFEVRLAGDSNGDQVFNSTDLIHVFRIGEYNDQVDGNSIWEDGDWNGDGDFTSADFVLAFQLGQFQFSTE